MTASLSEHASPFVDEDRPATVVTVGVVSAYPSVRAGLRVLLQAEPGLRVIADADSLDAFAPETAEATVAAVLVIDLPAGDVREWFGPYGGALPDAGLVLLGPVADGARLLARLGARPFAYLPRDAEAAELAAAVNAVHAGLSALHPTLTVGLFAGGAIVARAPDGGEGQDDLTPRELEVLALLAEGIPNKAIARRLGISDHTVKFHVGSVLSKLDAASRTEAVRIGARRGLIAL